MASNTLTSDGSLENILFEYPGADIILRSHDSHHFRVPKSYIIHSSPALDELIHKVPNPPDDAQGGVSLPVVPLPESGVILHNLLTFIFPVTPLMPQTIESTMELLSVAQKYQMVPVLDHIRCHITRKLPPSTDRDTALHVYFLSQQYGLHQETLQAAKTILKYPINIGELGDMLDICRGSPIYDLWKYYQKVRAILVLDLTEFRASSARGTLTGLSCQESSSSRIPRWLDNYIASIGDAPSNFFDHIGFNTVLARHIKHMDELHGVHSRCTCASIPSQIMRNFWKALTSVVDECFEKVRVIVLDELLRRLKYLQAESVLSPVQEREDSQARVNQTTTLPEPMDLPDASLIIQSSDLVNFRVHKLLLVMISPFFKEMLSLPQPPDSESVDGLPMVPVSEDAELLNSLISMIYPVRPVVPASYEKVLDLLSACQKYEMVSVQSSIRAEVDRGSFPAPVGTEVFRAYAIASRRRLIPETERAARLTLDYPMTFETLGEGLQLFEGWAVRDLVNFRRRCSENFVACLEPFLQFNTPGPSNIWVSCPEARGRGLPGWLHQVLSPSNNDLFTHALDTPSKVREKYLAAIQTHYSCKFCMMVVSTDEVRAW
jgi:hypothetical protein